MVEQSAKLQHKTIMISYSYKATAQSVSVKSDPNVFSSVFYIMSFTYGSFEIIKYLMAS